MAKINSKLLEFNKSIEGKKVAILGIGVSNAPIIEYFANLDCEVSVFDSKEENEVDEEIKQKCKKFDVTCYFGKDNLKNLHGFDYIFRSPIIRPDTKEIAAEVKKGAILTSEVKEVIQLSNSHIIGVTGSDGKTTTTTLIYEIMKANGYKCFLGGNIGIPLFTMIRDMKPDDYVILELSSFQLMDVDTSPEIAVVTNISPNHLNVHKDYQEYIDSKKNIFIHQNEKGKVIINKENEITSKFDKDAKGEVIFFSGKHSVNNGVYYDNKLKTINVCFGDENKVLLKKKELNLRGDHNIENICAALGATYSLIKDEQKTLDVIKNFKGVEHRLEYVRTINNVKWYNDSIGTSPTRTIAGLNSFDEDIVLIAGGYDKHLDYEPIAKPIIDNCSKLILMGATAPKIEEAVTKELNKQRKEGIENSLEIYNCTTLEEVVNKANEIAKPGEIILFSPASASFDLFKNFEERGNKFKELVNDL